MVVISTLAKYLKHPGICLTSLPHGQGLGQSGKDLGVVSFSGRYSVLLLFVEFSSTWQGSLQDFHSEHVQSRAWLRGRHPKHRL